MIYILLMSNYSNSMRIGIVNRAGTPLCNGAFRKTAEELVYRAAKEGLVYPKKDGVEIDEDIMRITFKKVRQGEGIDSFQKIVREIDPNYTALPNDQYVSAFLSASERKSTPKPQGCRKFMTMGKDGVVHEYMTPGQILDLKV